MKIDVEDEKRLLTDVIIAFQEKAEELIHLLSRTHNLDLKKENPFGKLISKANNLRQGQLEGNWTYRFHGDACQFVNTKTNQLVDVKINRGENFGALTIFYLLQFIATTKSLSNIFHYINTQEKVHELMSQLLEEKILLDVSDAHSKTIILNSEFLQG